MIEGERKRRVVITGYGMITPLGKDCEETFGRASRGHSGIDFITSFDTTGLPCRIAGEVKDEWIEATGAGADDEVLQYSGRGLTLMNCATAEAALMAGLSGIANRERVGVSLGFHGDYASVEDIVSLHRHLGNDGTWDMKGLIEDGAYSPVNFLRRKPDIAVSGLSRLFDCRGPGLPVVSACAAGTQAIGEACSIIRDGKADVMIAGGCESTLNFLGFIGFVLIRAMAEKYTDPRKASRPFDRRRSGFVMSEGAGALILEDLDHARSRRAPVYGEVLGYGASADAYRITDVHPKGTGAVLAMRRAIEDAGLSAGDVDYINAHGTSTTQNDPVETRAIREVFGDRAGRIPVSSNKSMLGHTIAAAGAIECILSLIGMHRSIILPTINYEFPDPKCDLDYVPNEARTQEHGVVLSNSFGFGGQNACLCIGKFNE